MGSAHCQSIGLNIDWKVFAFGKEETAGIGAGFLDSSQTTIAEKRLYSTQTPLRDNCKSTIALFWQCISVVVVAFCIYRRKKISFALRHFPLQCNVANSQKKNQATRYPFFR